MQRPDRPIALVLPADDPEAAAGDADLVEALTAGRQQVAFWQAEGKGRPKIVVLLGPVPDVERNNREVRRLSSPQVGVLVVLASVAFVLLGGWLASMG
jgi:hypothetical protein